jgi:leucine dehydrogenase
VIHDTSLGPALGGIRCIPYADEGEALADAMRLARGMTLKCLLNELPAGGGKAAILDHPGLNRPAAFAALGEFIERMGGRFFTAADLGTTPADLRSVGRATRFVATPEHGVPDDLGERAAEGVYLAASTALDFLGIDEWKGQRIAIQGLGSVGARLAMLARRAGARVFASDVNSERAGHAADTLPITLVEPDRIWEQECEVFAPCAGSHVLDATTIPRLRSRIVCGSTNQPLATDEAGDQLAARNVLVVPDLLASAGAVILGCTPALPGFERPRDLSGIARRLRSVLAESLRTQVPPHRIANARAEQLLREARERRRGEAVAR